MSDTTSGAEILARIKPTRREESTQLCLRPDILDAWEEANDALAKASENTPKRLAGDGQKVDTEALAQQVQDLEKQIEESAITFHFRSVSKDKWQALCDSNPPREGNDVDFYTGYNRDAVLDEAIRMCLVSPQFADCEDPQCDHEACGTWQQVEKLTNPSEWQELRGAVNRVNRGVVDAPKSALASRILARRDRGSEPQPATE